MRALLFAGLISVFVLGALGPAPAATSPDDAASAGEEPRFIIGTRMLDLEGNIRRLGDEDRLRPVALVFLDTYCSISSRYLPELNDLAEQADAAGVDFYGVFSDPMLSWDHIRQVRDEYGLTFPVLFDASGDLASRLAPAITPEAFIVGKDDRIAYRGRIDNRFAAIGALRKKITAHDLRDAIQAISTGEAIASPVTEPVGCIFEAWKDGPIGGVTYARDIAPIIGANCAGCHQKGGIAPFPLEDYWDTRRRAQMIAKVTTERFMPPWQADPTHGRFRDERILSERQIALLRDWVDAGAPEGDAALLPPKPKLPPADTWRLGEPDILVTVPEPFDVPATGDDIYRYFVIPSGLVKDEMMVALDFRPGDPSVVHHAIVFIDYSGRARKFDAEDPEPGFQVFGTGGFMSYTGGEADGYAIGGWAPGAEPYQLPEDHGIFLGKGGDIVIEVHYHLTGKATRDQSSLAIYTAKKPLKGSIDAILLGTQDVDIAPGDSAYQRHVWMDVPAGMTITDVTPHMHYIGKEAKVVVTFPDGTRESLIRIGNWDFRWQNVHVLREPLHVPAGSRIDAWFTFDNRAENPANPNNPAKRVWWGWGSDDEMAEVYITTIPDDWSQRDLIQQASWAAWMRDASTAGEESDLVKVAASSVDENAALETLKRTGLYSTEATVVLNDAWVAGEWETLIDTIRGWAEAEPENADAQALRADMAALASGFASAGPEQDALVTEAFDAYAKALSLDPTHWEARLGRAVLSLYMPPDMGLESGAVSTIEAVIAETRSGHARKQIRLRVRLSRRSLSAEGR